MGLTNQNELVFYFIVKEGNPEWYMALLMLEGSELYNVSFGSRKENTFVVWHTEKQQLCRIEKDEDILKKLSSTNAEYHYASAGCRLKKVDYAPGRFYPRIWRPQFTVDEHSFYSSPDKRINEIINEINQVRPFLPHDSKIELGGVTQLGLLLDNLKTIFKTIQPVNENLPTFGYEIRNLLVLACTEVEAQLKGIYKANAAKIPDNLNMSAYFTLNKYLGLNAYRIQYPFYPQLKSFQPFEQWSGDSYRPLPWYQAYNAVKHNRESEFHQATLDNVIEAISGAAILLLAQYGSRPLYWKDLIGQFVKILTIPAWDYGDYYMPPIKEQPWMPTKILN